MHWENLDNKKKGLLICSMICFVIGLVGFVLGWQWVVLIGFTLAAALPVLAVGSDKGVELSEGYTESDDEMINVLQERLDNVEEQLKVRNQTIESKDKELQALNRTIVSRDEEIGSLKKQLEEGAAPAESEPAPKADMSEIMASILPQVEGADKKETLDITGEIKAVASDFARSAEDAGVEIRVVDPAEPMYVAASPIMIRTMFRDIIDNAIKYMQRSGSLQITIANLDDDIFIAMKDNGEGLSESETVHIFELNYQGSNRISGNGLGLAQVKAIVDYYGGMIYAKSSPGRGMGIYLHLPAERV